MMYRAAYSVTRCRQDAEDVVQTVFARLLCEKCPVELVLGTLILNEPFSLRIGIDTGPVVAGVIGTTKFAYDVWGRTVDTAVFLDQALGQQQSRRRAAGLKPLRLRQ